MNHSNIYIYIYPLLPLLQGSQQYHRPALTEFVHWCDNCYLDLNVTKSKEMTVDFRRQEQYPLLSLLQGSQQYQGPPLTEFVDWCDNCYLDLNVAKTKEMTVDFRRQEHSPGKTIIHNNKV